MPDGAAIPEGWPVSAKAWVKVVTGPEVAAGQLPEGYSPLWRVPDQDAWYCVPTWAAHEIRAAEEYAGRKDEWKTYLLDHETDLLS